MLGQLRTAIAAGTPRLFPYDGMSSTLSGRPPRVGAGVIDPDDVVSGVPSDVDHFGSSPIVEVDHQHESLYLAFG